MAHLRPSTEVLVQSAGARYDWAVVPKRPSLTRRFSVVLALLLATVSALAADKIVRLRNENILTPEKGPRLAAQAKAQPEPAYTGLFVLQFDGPLEPAWRAELAQRGVTLIRYVPDHAFVARANGVPLRNLENLPYVRWTGSFRPEHKIHGGLLNQKAAGGDVAVSIMLAPDASPQQLAGARGLMKTLSSESASRFGGVWRGVVPRTQLNALAASDAVLWVERAPQIKLFDETASKIVGGASGSHATYVQSLGYDGSGVVVAVADSGLHLGDVSVMHPDLLGRVDALFYYGALTDASDEHGHGTHVTGIVAANGATGEFDDYGALWGLGVASGAHVIMQRIFDGAGNFEAPPSFAALTHDALTAGADIGSNSWGDDTQGRYDISAAEFDALVRDANTSTPGDQPYILEFSAGNAGPGAQTVGSPAVAKNVIATGVATLTGAVVRALGPSVAGVLGTNPDLIRRVIAAGESHGEAFWELPLVEEYRDSLKTPYADINNIAAGGVAGAITAALFLREFVPENVAWAHLDIAGPMFRDRDWRYYEAGALGFGVKTLVHLVERFRDPVCEPCFRANELRCSVCSA